MSEKKSNHPQDKFPQQEEIFFLREMPEEEKNRALTDLYGKETTLRDFFNKGKENVQKTGNKVKESFASLHLKEKKDAFLHKIQETKQSLANEMRRKEEENKEKRAKMQKEKEDAAKQKQKKDAEPSVHQEDKTEEKKPSSNQNKLLPSRKVPSDQKAKKYTEPLPEINQTLDLSSTTFRSFMEETTGEPQKGKKRAKARRDISKKPLTAEEAVVASLDGMYGVYQNPEKNKKKTLSAFDMVRYGILFICIFGFLTAGFYVVRKVYDYYRSYVVYSGLQELVKEKDLFSGEYLKKALVSVQSLTPEEVLEGKTPEGEKGNSSYTEEQETLVNKIGQLKKINPDTTGWISIKGTVVNYPLLYSTKRNYYLKRDFYGKTLSGGAIFIDERNSPDITKNRNTVIYGHNMADGSMFSSVHDFANASVFYGSTIEIATQEGIFVYTPFSVHQSNAFDNYFETDFVSDDDFIHFCEQMAFISLFETDVTFHKNSQIITLSTCMNNENSTDGRFAVHAILTGVIR